MNFALCMFEHMPQWDELPVAKLLDYPNSQDINQNIFAQARLCYVEKLGLVGRIWSFEVDPQEGKSRLGFYLTGEKKDLRLEFTFSGKSAASIGGEPVALKEASFFQGDDLQGEYWGAEFVVPPDRLEASLGGGFPIKLGQELQGNFTSSAYTEARLFPAETGRFTAVNY